MQNEKYELLSVEEMRKKYNLVASNRPDILDKALLRPGRFDRIIEVPLPSFEGRLEIFHIHSKRMNKAKDVNLEELALKTEELSGAEIKAICTEAGMFAIRENHVSVSKQNFEAAIDKVKKSEHLKPMKEMGVMFA